MPGAKTAHNKCLLMTSCPATRKQLKQLTWDERGSRMPVRGNARDLGAFFNSTGQRLGGTSIKRMVAARTDVERIATLPRTVKAIERMLATKAVPKALYGVETTQP